MPQIYVVVAIAGILTVLFDAAYQSTVPDTPSNCWSLRDSWILWWLLRVSLCLVRSQGSPPQSDTPGRRE
jgi:hypothetical protein